MPRRICLGNPKLLIANAGGLEDYCEIFLLTDGTASYLTASYLTLTLLLISSLAHHVKRFFFFFFFYTKERRCDNFVPTLSFRLMNEPGL